MGRSKVYCFAQEPVERTDRRHPGGLPHVCVEGWEHDGKHKCDCGHRWRHD